MTITQVNSKTNRLKSDIISVSDALLFNAQFCYFSFPTMERKKKIDMQVAEYCKS